MDEPKPTQAAAVARAAGSRPRRALAAAVAPPEGARGLDRGAVRLEERLVGPPGPGDLLLRMRVSGLCGTDLHKLAHGTAPPGAVLGHEIVGEVLEAGEPPPAPGAGAALPAVRGLRAAFAPGDRIVVPHHVACGACALCLRGSETLCQVFRESLLEPGGFCELILVRARAAARAARTLPPDLPDDAAVFLEPAACVLRGVRRAGLPSPDAALARPSWAAVLGAGSMGLLHLLVLKAVRADVRVLVVDGVRERLDLARTLGADAAADPADAPGRIRAETDGLGADAVFDTVGGASLLDAALGLLREGGTAVLFAHALEGERAAFELNDVFKHERRVAGSYSGGLSEQDEVFGLLIAGRLDPRPLVTHRLPLSRFEEGVALARERRALKVLYTPG